MQIGSKVLLLLFTVWLISISVFYVGTNELFLKYVNNLEKIHIFKNLYRGQSALEQFSSSYAATNIDWAHWNDLYSYIETKNKSFIAQNILPNALKNIHVDIIAFLDKKGEVVYGGMLSPDSKIISLPHELTDYFGHDSIIRKQSNLVKPIKTFIKIPSGILFITANGISNSIVSAPMNGTIVTGTYLKQEVINQLSKNIEIPTSLIFISDIKINSLLYKKIANAIASKSSTFYLINNDQYVDGYIILKDIRNIPIAVLKLEIYRYVTITLLNSIIYFILFSIFVFILSACTIWYIINKFIINRLKVMNNKIKIISNSHDYNQLLSDKSDDEIGSLAKEFNNMMNEIIKNQHSLIIANMLTNQSESLFKHSFDHAAIGMAIVSPEGKFLKVNKSLCELVGYSEDELLRTDFQTITHPEDLNKDLDFVNKTLSGEIQNYRMRKRYSHKSGKIIWILLNVSLVRDTLNNKPLYFIAQIVNITKQKHMEEKLLNFAFHDHLTSLSNRKLLENSFLIALKQAKNSHTKLAVCFLDLDNFKKINDQFGHKIGDEILKKIAIRIKKHVRSKDILARLGGDEFILVITDIDEIDSVVKIIQKIQKIVAKPYQIDGAEFKTTVSIGISIYPDHGGNLQTLINNADKALYAVKRSGRNQYQIFYLSGHSI